MTTQPTDTEPTPLREKLLPQASIRFFLVLIGASAVVMVVFRSALVGEAYWTKIAALVFATTVACFAAYASLFLLANLFSVSMRPVRSALGYESEKKAATREES